MIIEILKFLPRTNCRKCGRLTCTVFAAQMAEGGRSPEHCPVLSLTNQEKLIAYLAQFDFD
jgi:CO dehydrogenase/acetyl-CoA synthase gamma subunit (corrinoid Fe-S protein)